MSVPPLKDLSILAISYGRDFLDPESRNHQRLQFYAEALHRYETVVFTSASEGYAPVTAGNLTVHPTNSWSRLTYLFGSFWTGYRALKQHKGERWVITSQDPFDTGLIAYLLHRATGHPFHIQLHADAYGAEWVKDSRLNPYRQKLGLWLMRRAGAVRVVSVRVKRSLVALGIPAEKITVIPISGDVERFLDAPTDRDFMEEKEPDEVTVITVSRLEAEKNLSLLLQAFAQAHSTEPRLRLVIVGRGREEQRLKAEANTLGITDAVRWLPWSNSVAGYIAASDIYALPSRHEGWGMVLIEAMATGTPVVTTDVGCVGEFLTDGVHGLVAPVGDVASFATHLVTLGQSQALRTRYGIEGKLAVKAILRAPETARSEVLESIAAVYYG